MNKIGEIIFNKEIKIEDAFGFPEEFSIVNISNLREGIWYVFNSLIEDEDFGDFVSDFFVIEKSFFDNNNDVSNYNWKLSEDLILIDKGILGIFNKNYNASESHFEDCEDLVSGENKAGVLHNFGVVCQTKSGNDDVLKFDFVKENDTIFALRFKFN